MIQLGKRWNENKEEVRIERIQIMEWTSKENNSRSFLLLSLKTSRPQWLWSLYIRGFRGEFGLILMTSITLAHLFGTCNISREVWANSAFPAPFVTLRNDLNFHNWLMDSIICLTTQSIDKDHTGSLTSSQSCGVSGSSATSWFSRSLLL